MKRNSMIIKPISLFILYILVFTGFLGFIQVTEETGAIIVPIDYPTIQSAIENATEGSTIYVWAGTYYENVILDKTLTLIGNGTGKTTIDGDYSGGAIYINADWVNVSGITVTRGSNYGIRIEDCSHVEIDDCELTGNEGDGLRYYHSDNITVNNTRIVSNYDEGIYFLGWMTKHTTIIGCNISDNSGTGIEFDDASNVKILDCIISSNNGPGISTSYSSIVTIQENRIWDNVNGIELSDCPSTTIENCTIFSNTNSGVVLYGNAYTIRDCNITSNGAYGIFLISATNSLIFGTNISNNSYGIRVQDTSNTIVINSSINNSNSYDLYLRDRSELVLLNTTFNKTSVYFYDAESELTVMWYMYVYVNDTLGNPVSDAEIIVRNATGVVVFDGWTESDGYCRWIVVTEYLENQGSKVEYTPNNVTASNETLIGWAIPEPIMNSSKLVSITLNSIRPTVDYIVIEESIGGGWVGDTLYIIEDTVIFYIVGYNYSAGFVGLVSADWNCNDTGLGNVDPGPSTSTTFTAISDGICHVTAQNGSMINSTGNLTIIWLVENLDQGTHYPSIQKAIDAANPGDRLRTKPWRYLENVIINKTVTFMGQDRETTIIDGNISGGAIYINADWVNVSGITVIRGSNYGIRIEDCSHVEIDDCELTGNEGDGLQFYHSDNITVNNTRIVSNYDEGIYFLGWMTKHTTIIGCNISDNSGTGIEFDDASNVKILDCIISSNNGPGISTSYSSIITIQENRIWDNVNGIEFSNCPSTTIENCTIFSNTNSGVVLYGNAYTIRDCNITSNGAYGIFLISATNSLIFGTNISNNSYGIRVQDTSNTIVINSSINNSNSYDLYLRDRSELALLNTTFNKTSVYFYDAESELTVMWYMHVYVNDTLGNPVSDAKVIVRNATGVVVFDRLTDTEGYCKWIVVTEYIENLEYTDYHTPHNVTASNETLIGRATPEPNMDRSKLENIILYKKPTIDFIEISDALGGTPLTGGTVPPNYQEWGYCSAYNYTLGYIETISANWTAQGGVCFLLGPTPAETNGIDVGNTPGNVWLNASYFNGTSWYNDSVMYTIPTPPIVPGAPRELRIHRGGGTWPATQDDLYITWIAPTENWEHLKYNILYYDTDLSNGFQYDNYLLLGRNSSGPGTQDFCVLQGWYADSYNYVFKVNTTNDTKGSYENMTGTNVGYKYGKVLDSTMDFVWVSLPYHCDYTNATLITDDAFPDDTHISSIKKWNYTTQSYEVRTYLLGKWEGDFNIEPGDAVLIFVTIPSGSYNWKIVGAHDPDLEFELHENLGTTDFKILSLPYHRSYQNATHITNEFPDRSKIETVGQYNYTSNKWETRHNSLILGWMGDFDVQSSPVDVILLDVTSTVPYYWKPQVMDF